jgi:hypothetical protein
VADADKSVKDLKGKTAANYAVAPPEWVPSEVSRSGRAEQRAEERAEQGAEQRAEQRAEQHAHNASRKQTNLFRDTTELGVMP